MKLLNQPLTGTEIRISYREMPIPVGYELGTAMLEKTNSNAIREAPLVRTAPGKVPMELGYSAFELVDRSSGITVQYYPDLIMFQWRGTSAHEYPGFDNGFMPLIERHFAGIEELLGGPIQGFLGANFTYTTSITGVKSPEDVRGHIRDEWLTKVPQIDFEPVHELHRWRVSNGMEYRFEIAPLSGDIGKYPEIFDLVNSAGILVIGENSPKTIINTLHTFLIEVFPKIITEETLNLWSKAT